MCRLLQLLNEVQVRVSKASKASSHVFLDFNFVNLLNNASFSSYG